MVIVIAFDMLTCNEHNKKANMDPTLLGTFIMLGK